MPLDRNRTDRKALLLSHTGELGGAELFLADLVRSNAGQFCVCLMANGPLLPMLRNLGVDAIVMPARQTFLGIRRDSNFSRLLLSVIEILRLAWRLSGIARECGVICANSQKSLYVAALAALISRRKLVWILHDIISDHAFGSVARAVAIWSANTFAAKIVVNSNETGRAAVECGADPSLLRCIYNGFELERFKARSQFLSPGGRPKVALIGRLARWKGQHVLLDALRSLPQVDAVIVGAAIFGEDDYERHLHELVRTWKLEDRVSFLGFRSDIPTVLADVDIVVHASVSPEPFGRVIVEGMLAECLVIASDAGGVREIIDDGKTGILLAPGRPELVVEAISWALKFPQEARRIAAAGFVSASDKFALSRTRKEFEDMVAELVGG